MLRLRTNKAKGDASKEANFEIVSLDEDGQVRELAPDETLCDRETFKMVQDPSWTVTTDAEVQPGANNQYTLNFKDDVVGFGSLELGCMVEGSPRNALALVEVVLDKQVAAGGAHSCATKDNGSGAPLLRCWGSNEFHAIGLDFGDGRGGLVNYPLKIDVEGGQVGFLDAGLDSTCVITVQGHVECSGAKLMVGSDNFKKLMLPGTANIIDISVGDAHACAVSQDGELYCWGDNKFGQLGQGDTMPKLLPPMDGKNFPEPVQVDATRKWARVSAGAQHTCALDIYGQAFCWGENGFGRLGDGTEASRLSPVAVASPNKQLRFVSIAAADTHTCAVERSGSVYCWGQNYQGRLGQPSDPNTPSLSSPQLVSGGAVDGRFALDLDASAGSTCALMRKPGEKIQPVCWGENSKGQLGRPATNAQLTPELFQSPPTSHTLDLAMGPEHGCLSLLGEASPQCWGAQQNNRLGDGEVGFEPLFKQVNLPEGIADASFQSNHGCVALDSRKGSTVSDSNVICWGLNNNKQANDLINFTVGNPSNTPSLQLSESTDSGERPKDQKLSKVFTGPSHSCGLDADGVALCWGGNWKGQANPKNTETQVIMAGVSATARFTQLALGQGFTCGLVQGGGMERKAKIACWGDSAQGRLGNAMKASCPNADDSCGVVGAQGASLNAITFTHLAAATATSCAIGKLDTKLVIYCWGAKVAKDATKVEQANTAVMVWEETAFKAFAFAAGDAHFCALVGPEADLMPSQLLCWGDNSFGEATGASEPWVHLPTAVPGVNASSISSMALGSDHTCALLSSGELSCWGRNNVNQLNDSTSFSRKPNDGSYAPTFSDGTRPKVERLLGGASSTCVQTASRVYCAGDNAYRQLGGNPPGDISPTPVSVVGF